MIRPLRTQSLVRAFTGALVVLVLAGTTVSEAQRGNASIRMSVSSHTVVVDEPFELEVEVQSDAAPIEHVSLPPLAGFRLVGRRIMQPMHVSVGPSGRPVVSRSVVHSLTLVAEREGQFDIQPASARIGTSTLRSERISLKVVGGGASDPDPVTPQAATPAPGGDASAFDEMAFVRTVVDNPNPWLGQQVTVTLYLYWRVGGQARMTQPPATDGFWIQDLLDPTSEPPEQIMTVRGVQFRVQVIKRFAAFALRPGSLPLGGATVSFGPGITLFGRTPDVVRSGPPVTVNVRPLPPGGPTNPLIGRFEAAAEISPSTVRTGEAAMMTVVVRGVGNLRDARVTFPSIRGLRADQPTITDTQRIEHDLVGGERKFRFLVVATEPGTFQIPDLRLPVFDPSTGAFAELHTTPLDLEAIGSAASARAADPEEPEEEDTSAQAEHPLRVRGTSELTRARARLSDARFYPLAVALPPLAFLAYLLATATRDGFSRRREAQKNDRRKQARKQLGAARALADKGDVTAFYAALARALGECIEARVGEPIGSLTHGELQSFLAARGMEDDLARRIVDELEGSDFARFSASGSSKDELARAHDRTEALIVRIEKFSPKGVPA